MRNINASFHRIFAILVVLGLTLGVQADDPPPAADAASSTSPEKVVSSLIDAMAAQEAEKIRALFSEDASQAYGEGRAKAGQAFFRWLESDIIRRDGRVEGAEINADGREVVVTGTYRSRGYSSVANFLFTVDDGKITSWRMRY